MHAFFVWHRHGHKRLTDERVLPPSAHPLFVRAKERTHRLLIGSRPSLEVLLLLLVHLVLLLRPKRRSIEACSGVPAGLLLVVVHPLQLLRAHAWLLEGQACRRRILMLLLLRGLVLVILMVMVVVVLLSRLLMGVVELLRLILVRRPQDGRRRPRARRNIERLALGHGRPLLGVRRARSGGRRRQ